MKTDLVEDNITEDIIGALYEQSKLQKETIQLLSTLRADPLDSGVPMEGFRVKVLSIHRVATRMAYSQILANVKLEKGDFSAMLSFHFERLATDSHEIANPTLRYEILISNGQPETPKETLLYVEVWAAQNHEPSVEKPVLMLPEGIDNEETEGEPVDKHQNESREGESAAEPPSKKQRKSTEGNFELTDESEGGDTREIKVSSVVIQDRSILTEPKSKRDRYRIGLDEESMFEFWNALGVEDVENWHMSCILFLFSFPFYEGVEWDIVDLVLKTLFEEEADEDDIVES